ncbi:MAG: YbjQ family protein [Methyloligellaceae bacterium]
MTLHTIERFSNKTIIEGELVTVTAVEAANIVKDIRERITNTFGGQMKRYEGLIEKAVERAMARLDEKAKEKGYDGVIGVRFSHPSLVDGGVEVIAYGTGFNYS